MAPVGSHRPMQGMKAIFLASAVLLGTLAGCAATNDPDDVQPGTLDGPYTVATTRSGAALQYAPGAVSTVSGGEGGIDLPAGTLILAGTQWTLHEGGVVAAAAATSGNGTVTFLPSPGLSELVLGNETFAAPTQSPARFLDGGRVVELLQFQADNFPDRDPDHPNYAKSLDWAAQHLTTFGYDVEVDPYGFSDHLDAPCIPEPFLSGQQACLGSFANVVATKQGTDPLGPIVVVGGHYDIVPQITYGAYDNTAGAMTVVALAEAMANMTTRQTLVFALWGGEESGLLGSSFWLASHPAERARMSAYWNMDVVGLSWPAPLIGHVPLTLHVGPESNEGPAPQAMLAWAQSLQTDWMQYAQANGTEANFVYVSGRGGVVTSDSAAFLAAGVPSFTPESYGSIGSVYRIHEETDTLENMTRFAWFGNDVDFDAPWPDNVTHAQARELVARSFDPYMWFFFYHVVVSDERGFGVAIPQP